MGCIREWLRAMVIVWVMAGVVGAGEPVHATTLTVGAAYSLRSALDEILPMFEKEYGATVQVVYGPSHTLRRQIEHGAPIDVFLPAAVREVEELAHKRLTLKGGVRIYAQTSLVLVMSATSEAIPLSFRDVLPNRATRIVLGDPKTSALGELTARALTRLDPAYKAHFNLLRAQDSQDIMDWVRRGQADEGIIYRVDAINSRHLRIIDETPGGTYSPVYFAGAVVWTCRKTSLVVAEDFLDFMMSPRIQKLLLKDGFESPPSQERRIPFHRIAHEH